MCVRSCICASLCVRVRVFLVHECECACVYVRVCVCMFVRAGLCVCECVPLNAVPPSIRIYPYLIRICARKYGIRKKLSNIRIRNLVTLSKWPAVNVSHVVLLLVLTLSLLVLEALVTVNTSTSLLATPVVL